jgi:hypothetical protein
MRNSGCSSVQSVEVSIMPSLLPAQPTRRPNTFRRRITAAIALLALAAATASPVAAANVAPETYEEIRNHVTCYAFGLDKIGVGDEKRGLEIWKDCYSPDFQFTLSIPGQTVVCPGEGCPFPKDMDPVSMRAAFASRAYKVYQFERTAHHLTNITINPTSDDRADVHAYVQAWHQRRDNFALLGSADWRVAVAKRGGKWMIVREDFKIIMDGLLVPAGPPPEAHNDQD